MGRWSTHKYRVKWTNLSEELISEYGANHGIFQDPAKERPQKVPKIHIDVHRRSVQVGLHKLRAIYILLRSSVR